MPNFVSVGGVWKPRKESAMMTNTFGKTIESEFITASDGSHVVKPGENFLYNGPDREAVKKIKEEGEQGRHFKNDPEFLQAVRNMGFNNVEEYLKHIGYNEKSDKEKQEKLIGITNAHEDPKKVEEILVLAGGKDMSGNKSNDVIGGFGPERLRSPEEITKQRVSIPKE
jgi:general stress protein YciG